MLFQSMLLAVLSMIGLTRSQQPAVIEHCKTYNEQRSCIECDQGFFVTKSGSLCQGCQAPCVGCNKLPTNCTACKQGDFLDALPDAADTFTCHACSSKAGCLECTMNGDCTKCDGGFFLQDGECQTCGDHCLECSDTLCTKCEPSFFKTTGSDCKACSDSCKTCVDGGKFDECASCKPGTYLSIETKSCVACDANCLECNGAGQCTKCAATGYYLMDGKCLGCKDDCVKCANVKGFYNCTQCKNKATFLRNGECLSCGQNCATCTSATVCKTCVTGPFFVDGGKCSACHENCNKCKSASECSECKLPTMFNDKGMCRICGDIITS